MNESVGDHDGGFAVTLDSLVDAAIIGLRRWAKEQTHARFLLLCDPAAADPIGEVLSLHRLATTPLVLRHPDIGPSATPYLVHVDDEPRRERFVGQSVRMSITEAVSAVANGRRPRSVCAWIHTSMSMTDVARTLGSLSQIRVNGATRLWRYWDPRVLSSQFTNGQVATAPAAPADATWLFVDWLGKLQFLRPDLADVAIPPNAQAITSMNERIGVLQRVLHRRQIDSWLPEQQLARAIAMADEHGLTNADDRVRFAADLMTHGYSIAGSPRMNHILVHIRAGKGRYAAYTSDFEMQDWHALAAEGHLHSQSSSPQVNP